MSVQPVEPQTRVKSGRNAFILPDFQFRFNLTLLQPNDPLALNLEICLLEDRVYLSSGLKV
ncbi:uncharacterized protein K441DRAFT_669021 [Cenococcum geophilum 1.58]|uniref:uncharacterized protein n=1 Tax=Cenococcum geophilum 1.58 TaxID=794803 RepID=UPI0035901D40|nr:hypothetical protein K441DRAFT_669021 [Cenococcum geophilum 1.58]